jgi:hypothetical protein
MRYRYRYVYRDLGERRAGERVVVSLRGAAANVLLLDSQNWGRYRAGLRFSYVGGFRRYSPVRLIVPHDSHWYVAIDLGGRPGQTRAAVKVEPAGRAAA